MKDLCRLLRVLFVAAAILWSSAGVARVDGQTPAVAESSPATVLDLNTASAAELRALPGMGAAYVRRIIEGRPYTMKNQLVTRGILPQPAYDRIRERVVAHRPRRNREEKPK